MGRGTLLIAALLIFSAYPMLSTSAEGATEGAIGPAVHYASYFGGSSEDMHTALFVDDEGFAYVAAVMSGDFPVTVWISGNVDVALRNVIFKVDTITGEMVSSICFDKARVTGMAKDGNGSLYVTGAYTGGGLPTSYYAYSQDPFGGSDAFVAKFDPDETKLEYCTYIGGSGNDAGQSIAVDAEGNAYVFGQTNSPDFPTDEDGRYAPVKGGYDTYVLKLGPRGQEVLGTLTWGSEEDEYGWDCSVGPDGDLYVTGSTEGVGLASVSEGYRPTPLGDRSIQVAKVGIPDLELDYLALVGGTSYDGPAYLTVDAEGAACVAGTTTSVDFPRTPTSLNYTAMNGSTDGVVFKLDPTGTDLEFSARIGGSDDTGCSNIEIAEDGTLMVAGSTRSADFPTTEDAMEPDALGKMDVLYLEMSADGSELLYSTFLGSFGNDYNVRMGRGPDAAYLLYYTYSPALYVTENAAQAEKAASGDSFLEVLDLAAPTVLEDFSPEYTTDQHGYVFAFSVGDNLCVSRVYVEYWLGIGVHSEVELEMIEGTTQEGDWINHVTLNDVDQMLHYVVHAFDAAGHETVTEEVGRASDSESPTITADESDTEVVLGMTATFKVKVEDNTGISRVVLHSYVPWWGGDFDMELVGGWYVLTVDIPRNATKPAGDQFVVCFKVEDLAYNLLRTEEKRLPIVNLPPEVQPIPDWQVRPNEPAELDLAPYLSDGNDDVGNLTVKVNVAEVEVEGTVLYALFNEDFKSMRMQVEVGDGDDKVVTNMTIVNPDFKEDDGGMPGPTAPVMMLALLVAVAVARWRSRAGRRGGQ